MIVELQLANPARLARGEGSVSAIDAAQNLLSQGGVPNMALMRGSQAVQLRVEHVWVEANVAALPSRGSLSADQTLAEGQWIPLDASYKRHTRTAGIDLWIATVIVGLIFVLGGAAVIGGAIFAATAAGVAVNALIGVGLIGLLSGYTGLSSIFMAINVKTRDGISCNLMKLFLGSAAGTSITIGGLILGAVSNLVGVVVSESINQTVAAGIGAFALQCQSDRG